MVTLNSLHYIYIVMVLVVVGTMVARRDTVLPCIIGLFAIGFAFSGDFIKTIQIMFNALVAAGGEFLGIITVIALVVAMSKAMTATGIDAIIAKPAQKLMVNANVAFFVTGISMMLVAWFVWPSPAVALIGALILPVAVRAGLPVIGAAMAMNIFGHGVAMSNDWVIQGAPSITAKAAGLTDPAIIISNGAPLFITMSLVTVIVAFIMIKKDMKSNKELYAKEALKFAKAAEVKSTTSAIVFAFLIPLAFILDVAAMLAFDLKGGDATALIGGTALVLMSLISVVSFKGEALEQVTDFVREGFLFGIKVFAPVIVIGAFFFLGSEGTAKAILGQDATGLLTDIGLWLSQQAPLSAAPVAFIQMLVGGITGLDGSGFSGLPLVGGLAQTFSTAINGDIGVLAALGQISAVWVGGGTIIPWGLIPVAAICGVEPMDLARRNFIPVMAGFAATLIVAIFLI